MPLFQNYISSAHLKSVHYILPLIRADFTPGGQDNIHKSLNEIDWLFIARFADRQRILPILYFNLRKFGLLRYLPEAVHNSFQSKYMRNSGNNMRFAKRLVDIIKLFEQKGIPMVPFKGPVLAKMIYNDEALRYYQDLDLLVPTEMAMKAWQLLLESGYQPNKTHITEDQFKTFMKYENEIDLIANTGHIPIDLHWRFISRTRYSCDFDFCRKRLKKTTFNKQKVLQLSDEDTILSLCLHGSSGAWENLEMILCLSEYLTKKPNLDWQQVFDLADYLHCRRMLLLGLFLAQDLFNISIPDYVCEKLTRDVVISGLAAGIYNNLFQEHQIKNHMDLQLSQLPYQFGLRKKAADKIRYGLGRIFFPQQNDWQAIPLRPGIAQLHFLIRPIRQGIEFLRSRKVRVKGERSQDFFVRSVSLWSKDFKKFNHEDTKDMKKGKGNFFVRQKNAG